MNRLLLLFAIPVIVISELNVEKLIWNPSVVTRESILKENLRLVVPEKKRNVTSLAYVTSWNPRGFMLARKSAPRLDYVSPVWFEAEVEVDGYRMPSGVTIRGQENINHDFIQAMKKANPATKIVPRIKFEYMPETFKDLVTNEVLIRRIGQTIVEFLKKFRLGGAVIEFLYSDLYTVENDSWLKLNYYESCQSIAKTFKNHNLTAILAIPPPIGAYIHSGETKWIPAMTSKECTLLLKDFDFVHFWTYNDFSHQGHRINIEQIRRTHELCRESKKVMIGLNFYGTQYSLNEHRAGKTGVGNGNTLMGKEYLKLLSDPSAKLEFNYENMEHELVLERDKTIVFFPSMTSLEYRIELARELGVGVGIWDYGQGLDYFANLL